MGWMVRLAVPEMCRWLGKENEGSAKCLSPAGEGPQLPPGSPDPQTAALINSH